MTTYHASTLLSYSPRKTRLIINPVRGVTLTQAIDFLKANKRPKSKKIYDLLKSAMSNLKLTEAEIPGYKIGAILAEEAQRLYRVVPRARGSAGRIRRRYSRVKVVLEKI